MAWLIEQHLQPAVLPTMHRASTGLAPFMLLMMISLKGALQPHSVRSAQGVDCDSPFLKMQLKSIAESAKVTGR